MKATLPLAYSSPNPSRSKRHILVQVCFVLLLFVWLDVYKRGLDHTTLLSRPTADVCPQQAPYDPREALGTLHIQRPSVKKSVQLLSEAVQIDTTVGDSWPDPDEEPERWNEIFSPFASWIESSFPHMHAKESPVKREMIHQHGLLYTWEGSDASLKPLVLMSHQDVVPVEQNTVDQWTYPPFSGYIDLETQTVWGRGAVDCKLWLVSSLSAIESLLQSGFQPRRTVILSYGFDEESDGHQGASHIARFLEDRYGPNSMEMIGTYALLTRSRRRSACLVQGRHGQLWNPHCFTIRGRKGCIECEIGGYGTWWSLFQPAAPHHHWNHVEYHRDARGSSFPRSPGG